MDAGIERVEQLGLLVEGQQADQDAVLVPAAARRRGRVARRCRPIDRGHHVASRAGRRRWPTRSWHGQAELLEVVGALGATGRLAGRLHGGEEQRDQDGDDGDHDEQLDQRESSRDRRRSEERFMGKLLGRERTTIHRVSDERMWGTRSGEVLRRRTSTANVRADEETDCEVEDSPIGEVGSAGDRGSPRLGREPRYAQLRFLPTDHHRACGGCPIVWPSESHPASTPRSSFWRGDRPSPEHPARKASPRDRAAPSRASFCPSIESLLST